MSYPEKLNRKSDEIETVLFHLLYQLRTINRSYTVKVNDEINENYTRIVSHFNETNVKKHFM